MCRPHWFRLPAPMRVAVLRAFEPGQENGNPRPSAAWMSAAFEAIAFIARDDGFAAVANHCQASALDWADIRDEGLDDA